MKKIIAIALTLVLCLSVMSVASFAAPAGLESLALVGTGIPGATDWTPADAAGDMTEASNNVYEKTVTLAKDAVMTFKVAGNDAWDDKFNFGNGAELVLGADAVDLPLSSFGGDMTFKAAKDITVKFTVDLTAFDGAAGAKIKVEEVTAGGNTNPTQPTQPQATQPQATQPQATQPQATQPTTSGSTKEVTLSVKAPADWTNVYVYSWDANGAPTMGEWPGSKVNKNGDLFTGKIKADVTKVIINNGADPAVQTVDLQIDAGKDVTITLTTANADGKYEATIKYGASSGSSNTTTKPQAGKPADSPAPSGTLSNYRVVGGATWMGNWDPANSVGQMYDMGNGVYKKNFENVEPGSYELKVTKDGKWDVSYGDSTGQNFKFTVTEKCTITVMFALKDNVGVIEVYGTGVPSTADISMISVIVLLVLATTATAVLVINKKKFI